MARLEAILNKCSELQIGTFIKGSNEDVHDHQIKMMAWMNADSIRETLEQRRVCYWSRSRDTFWRKGDTSGNTQKLIEMRYDCDGDTILVLVDQKGPACHTGARNCFFNVVEQGE